MINLVAILFSVFMVSVHSHAEVTHIDCKNVESYSKDSSGVVQFTPIGASFEVYKSATGKYGWSARITNSAGVHVEDDVAVDLEDPFTLQNAASIISSIDPQFDYQSVQSIRMTNVGVDANSEDAGGSVIYEYLGEGGTVLAKAIQLGWGIGRCN